MAEEEKQTQPRNKRGPMGGGPIGMRSVDRAKDFKGTSKKLLSYLSCYKWKIIIVLVLSVTSTVLSIISPKILGKATTEISNGMVQKILGVGGINMDKLLHIILGLVVLYVISAVFTYIENYIMVTLSNKISFDLREDISKKFHRLPLKYYETKTTGEILSRVTNDVDTLSQNLSQSLVGTLDAIITIIGTIIMMLTISPLMTLISVIIVPISFLLVGVIIRNSQKYFKQQQEYLGVVNSQVEEMYSGHNVVKVFNGERKAVNKFNKANDVLYTAEWKSQCISGFMHPIMQTVGNLGYVVVAVIGGYLTIKGKMEIGYILSFSKYINNLNHPMVQIGQVTSVLQSAVAAAERVFEFLDADEEIEDVANPVSTDNIVGDISFNNVSFSYDGDKTVIHNFCADIKHGQKVAIVGPTGAGKTTMVKLLMRFYDVNSGSITIDGHNIKDFKREDLRNLFGMVLQDTWLFSGTIKDNIRYGRLNATDEDIVKAAKSAYVDYFIRTLPDSYDMVIDGDTSSISVGQRQLLTIARVILADPSILILDEATSSVDTRTELLIQKAMDKLMEGRTSFIIAHRLSTIKNADIILVMDHGDIVEVGNHKELLKKNGFYASIYNSQFEE